MSTAKRLKTNAELCAEADALPEPYVGEVIDGVLYTMSRPTPAHANTSGEIDARFRYGGSGGGRYPGWFIQQEVEVRFSNDERVVPDLSGWLSERISGHENDNPIHVVPDWVCEILSDSTRRKDLGPKRSMYARQGVGHLWLVDPEKHELEAFALDAQRHWVLAGAWAEDDVASPPPFTDLVFELGRWWLRLG